CPVCGRQYSPAELALLPTLAPILDESGPFCSRCGAYLFSDEPECAICGTSVTATPEVVTGGKGVVKDFLSRWQRMAPPSAATSPPKVVDIHLVEALNHYEPLLRADPTLVVAWKTKVELLERLGRPEDARASLAEADRLEKVGERSIRAAVTRLHSNGLATPGPTGAGRTNGRVNGTRSGRTNGRTNGRVNGMAEGRVNGLTTGAVNGLTFGRGAA